MPTLKEKIQEMASNQDLTLKEVANKADMSYNGLHNKFYRGSITVRDLEKILHVLGMKIVFVPLDKEMKVKGSHKTSETSK